MTNPMGRYSDTIDTFGTWVILTTPVVSMSGKGSTGRRKRQYYRIADRENKNQVVAWLRSRGVAVEARVTVKSWRMRTDWLTAERAVQSPS